VKLIDLHPRWIQSGGAGITDKDGKPIPERRGIGIVFDCPCGCESPCFVPFSNPLDGRPADRAQPLWKRTGETFETLTLKGSIRRIAFQGSCAWHGFVTNGEIKTV
jgi:hypothetical protein